MVNFWNQWEFIPLLLGPIILLAVPVVATVLLIEWLFRKRK